MWELISAGGLLMLPIILCSIAAAGIVAERFWTLKRDRVLPANLVEQVWRMAQQKDLSQAQISKLAEQSPLGRVLAAGLVNKGYEREEMKDAIEEVGAHVAHDLEKYLNTLGTIAAVTPLLGLLGTVIGMIDVFAHINNAGVGNPGDLAGGISKALVTTAGGISVAIPSLMFYRYFRGYVDELVIGMEQEALKLVEILHNRRSRKA
ncbi:MAG: MotA/TolQ/ExbB proton channel family protein [Gammaproteobacteria bacterium]|nr:MotA/TolQ/ExbB proton channel family protein [Gammaproteobacteria bacterium]